MGSSLLRYTAILIPLCAYLVSASAAVRHFKLTQCRYHEPSRATKESPVFVFCTVYDPATKTNGSCAATTTSYIFPAGWIQCDNPTFSMKVDSFDGYSSFGLEFKHQYKGNQGKACSSSSASDCTTARAYAQFGRDTPGYTVTGGGSGQQTESYTQTYPIAIFSKCDGGCGLSSGDY